jgi:hypothetical protein
MNHQRTPPRWQDVVTSWTLVSEFTVPVHAGIEEAIDAFGVGWDNTPPVDKTG